MVWPLVSCMDPTFSSSIITARRWGGGRVAGAMKPESPSYLPVAEKLLLTLHTSLNGCSWLETSQKHQSLSFPNVFQQQPRAGNCPCHSN